MIVFVILLWMMLATAVAGLLGVSGWWLPFVASASVFFPVLALMIGAGIWDLFDYFTKRRPRIRRARERQNLPRKEKWRKR